MKKVILTALALTAIISAYSHANADLVVITATPEPTTTYSRGGSIARPRTTATPEPTTTYSRGGSVARPRVTATPEPTTTFSRGGIVVRPSITATPEPTAVFTRPTTTGNTTNTRPLTSGTVTTGAPVTTGTTSTTPVPKTITEIKFTLNAPEYGKELDTKPVSKTEGVVFDHIYWEAHNITDAGGWVGQNAEGQKVEHETEYQATIYFKVEDGYSVKDVSTYPTSLKIGIVNDEKGLEANFLKVQPHNVKTQKFDVKKVEEVKEEVKEDKKEEVKQEETKKEEVQKITWSSASKWALEELSETNDRGLIPQVFDKEDLTKNITRKEFAHVAVRLYEKISGKKAEAEKENPFKDTKDAEVLKAYKVGITQGTSATTFEPDALITREQMATMMTRALQKAGVDTMVDLNKVEKFADDSEMSSWAKDSVYFMSNKEIIKGIGENKFGVKGNATREQSLLISGRSATKFAK